MIVAISKHSTIVYQSNWNWADADLNYLLAEANKELGALNT